MSQLDDLVYALHVGNFDGLSDETADKTIVPEHPLEEWLEKAAFETAGGTDYQAITGELAKRTKERSANLLGPSGLFGMALGLAKRKETIDGWTYTYGDRGELVSARTTSTDRAELHKNADEPHADGTEVETCGKQTWKRVYKGGRLQSMSVEDPELPDGRMFFDENGDETVPLQI